MESSKKLPPIDFKEEVERFKANQESKEVELKKCKHKTVKFKNGELRCTCGAGWSGGNLDELYKLLKG